MDTEKATNSKLKIRLKALLMLIRFVNTLPSADPEAHLQEWSLPASSTVHCGGRQPSGICQIINNDGNGEFCRRWCKIGAYDRLRNRAEVSFKARKRPIFDDANGSKTNISPYQIPCQNIKRIYDYSVEWSDDLVR